jgi:hypothetical protein
MSVSKKQNLKRRLEMKKFLTIAILFILACVSIAFSNYFGGYSAPNFNREGGADSVIGGEATGYLTIGPYGAIRFLDSDGNNESKLRVDVCDVSNAKIKTLFTSPVTLVSAPGAHKVIDVESVTLIHNYGGAQFDANSATIGVTYYYATSDTNTAATGTVTITNLLGTASADRIYKLIPVALGGAATLTENCPVRLTLPANTGDPTGTTATGTLRAIINYRVHSTGL